MRIDVGIGDFKVSRNVHDEIKTYALGSCVAVVAYDKTNKVAGLLHIALPESKINIAKAERMPGYFADTGIPEFINTMLKAGAIKKSISIKIAGGANVMDDKGHFDIGRRNGIAVKRELWKLGMGVIREDLGGNISRTVSITVEDGLVSLSNSQKKWTL